MKVLVIGASGHIGAHLVRESLAAGHTVRALVRPTSDRRGLAGIDVETVSGDVRDPESIARALAGREAVFHLGAPTRPGEDMDGSIVGGTRTVLAEALKAGVERLVYTSSIVTVGYSPSTEVVLDEISEKLTPASPYHVAKWQAEREVLECARRGALPIVVVNPATVVGPLDFRVTPSNAPIQQCLDRGLPVSFDSGLTVVHAQDVARGHLLALERGLPGERYILGGDRITIPDYFALIAMLCGRPGPRLKIPRAVMLAGGLAFSLLRGVGVRNVPFTYGQTRELVGRYGWYSSAKAQAALGYAWRPVRDAVAGYVDWVRAGRT